MRRSIVLAIVGLFVGLPGYAQHFDEETTYYLRMPVLLFEDRDYNAKRITWYDVRVVYTGDRTFLLRPIHKEYQKRWKKSLQEPDVHGWEGTIGPEGRVEISGVRTSKGGVYVIAELTGTFVTEDMLKGQAVLRVGVKPSSEAPYEYYCEWGLEPEDQKDSLDISHKVAYYGPSMSVKAITVSPEERSQWPINTDQRIKRFASHSPHDRERFYKGLPAGSKAYYDTLLTELSWEEIPYTPGILLLIDHLVTVDEKYKQKIAEGSVRDGSLHFFDPIPYEELQQVPPLFLILYIHDKMPEGDIAGLQEVSSRFVTMLEAYKTIPPEELTDLPVLEFIIKLSAQLPEEFRQTYFSQSPKLRNYVAASEDERLKELYPFSE